MAMTAKILCWKCLKCGFEWSMPGFHRARDNGSFTKCGCCAKKFCVKGINDMLTTHPKLAAQCLDSPSENMAGTRKKLRWQCNDCGHKWLATGGDRLRSDGSIRSCPGCKNKDCVSGVNDMLTLRPDLARECLDDPARYVPGTNILLRWKCSKCGYKWKAPGYRRLKGVGCRKCGRKSTAKKQRAAPREKSFAVLFPDLLLDYRGHDDPYTIYPKAGRKYNWFCWKCQGTYTALMSHRTSAGTGCPKCSQGGGHDQTQVSFIYLVCRPGQIKYGIMNTWTYRLKQHAKNGWELLDKIELAGQKARSLETTIRQTLRAKEIPTGSRAFRKKFPGYSETFQEVDLYVRTIRGLCRKLGVNLEAFLAS